MKNGKAKLTVAAAAIICTSILALALSGTAMADESSDAASAVKSYKVEDAKDSPPLNYRSNEDERYATPEQHDAEMYAEQYEKEKAEKELKDKALLDSMGRSSPDSLIDDNPPWPKN